MTLMDSLINMMIGVLRSLGLIKETPPETPGTTPGTETDTSGGNTDTKPAQTPDEYCKATYGADCYYDSELNACVKKKASTDLAGSAGVRPDSFNLWYADFLRVYGINHDTVASIDLQTEGMVQVVFKDGSRKSYPNPATLTQLSAGTKIIAPESSRQAAPVNISPPRILNDRIAEQAAVRDYLAEYKDWTHVSVNYGSNPSVYVYAQGLCDQYGKWYPTFDGVRDPVADYNAAQVVVITPKPCPVGYHWDQATAERYKDRNAGCVPDGAKPTVIVQNDSKPQDMRGQSCEAYALTKGAKGSSNYNYAIADCRERGGWG